MAEGPELDAARGVGGGRDMSPDELFNTGVAFLGKGKPGEALAAFRAALAKREGNPRYMSYAGYALALAGGKTKEAVKLCESALRVEFFQPEQYLNLGRVYLIAGNRRKAHQIFWKGHSIDPSDGALLAEIEKLGIRKPPVLPFLKRGNALNRIIGKTFYMLRLR